MSDIVYDPSKDAWCHLPSGACSTKGEKPGLPTYATVAAVLEGQNGSGVRLLGWTVARTVLIAPWFRVVGVTWKQAILGATLASLAISGLTLLRVSKTGNRLVQKARRRVVRRLAA